MGSPLTLAEWQKRRGLRNCLDKSAKCCKIAILKRYLEKNIVEDLHKKIMLLCGLRPVGVTWLAREITGESSPPRSLKA
jgi:hypothetical protein